MVSSLEKNPDIMILDLAVDKEIQNVSFDEDCSCSNQISHQGLGRIPLPDWIPSTHIAEPATFLNELDWRNNTYNGVNGNWLTSVKNQGNCGSCWAFAAIGCLEAMINIAANNPNFDEDLSEQYMVSCVPSAYGCNGGNAYDCYKYMKDDTYPNDGALPESCFIYTSGSGTEPSCSEKCSDWTSQLLRTITNYGRSSGSSQIKARLIQGPVCLSFSVYDDFYDYTSGVYEHQYGRYIADHQVVCVGYSDNGGYWICKNSWGPTWGENGYFKIKYGECYIESELVYCDFSLSNLPPNPPSNPYPVNHASNVELTAKLHWTCSDPNKGDIVTYDVYFGTNPSAPKVSSDQSSITYDPGTLVYNTKYYWRIVARDASGAIQSSPIWDFNTKNLNTPPDTPSNPTPPDQATDVTINITLNWIGSDPDANDTITYDVYFGSMPPFEKIASNLTNSSLSPGTLMYSLTYFWNVVAWDNHGSSTVGPGWQFTTKDPPNTPPNPPTITGKLNGTIRTAYDYTIQTTDPDQDTVDYFIDWGDNTNTGWIGPYNVNEKTIVTHSWKSKGTYVIKVKARDTNAAESSWATLTVTMPYVSSPIQQFLEWLFQRLPNILPLLRQLIEY